MNEIPVREFRSILRQFERAISAQNQSSCCCRVSLNQCHLLMELDQKDGITLNELSDRLGLDKSTVSRTVEALVNQGMVDRIIPKENRRTTRISLTNAGKETCRTINRGNDRYFKKILSVVPAGHREGFLEGFRLLTAAMEQSSEQ
jgi:DNA-binding MarR family transcriptional regulator